MNAEESKPLDEQFIDLLAARDEALAAGTGLAGPSAVDTPRDLEARLERGQACIQLLRQVLPTKPGQGPPQPEATSGLACGPTDLPLTQLGRFQIRRELGRGAFGVVFLAHDPRLGREVALKVPRPDALLTPELRQRFLREARAAAGLDHPNLVAVHDAGEEGPICFVASAYYPGITLAAWLKQRVDPVPVREAAELTATLAGAVQHAHQRGVIHRDLKPANILLQTTEHTEDTEKRLKEKRKGGEASLPPAGTSFSVSSVCSVVSGAPKITDFGLAKLLAEVDATQTQSGAILGTPSYMAPEQASGKTQAIGPAADIYALGAILYELLTGRPPFRGDTTLDTLEQVRSQEPVSPSRLRPKLPRDLETICLKCLHKEPAKRYDSAQALSDDLERWLGGKPIQARRTTAWERAVKWSRRHPALVGSAAVIAILAVAGFLTSAFLLHQEQAHSAAAQAQTEKEAHIRLERRHYFQTLALAERERAAHNAGAAEQLLEQCPLPLRGWEWDYLKRQRYGNPPPLRHTSHLFSLAVSPDGRWLAAGGNDGSVVVWDALLLRETHRLRAHGNQQVRGVAFSSSGRFVASAGWDGTIRVWETTSGLCLHSWPADKQPFAVAFSPDERALAASTPTAIARWDLGTGDRLDTLVGHAADVRRLAFSPDGRTLASGDDKGIVKIWDTTTGKEQLSFKAHAYLIFDVAYNHDGSRLLTASGQFYMHGDVGEAKLWDAASGAELRAFRTHTGALYAAAMSLDGTRLFTGGEDAIVRVWDVGSGEEALALRGHAEAVWGVALSPNGQHLFTASGDHTVRIWDASPLSDGDGPERLTLRDHSERVTSVTFSPDGRLLVSADMGGKLHVWNAADGSRLRTLDLPPGQAHGVAFSPDARQLAIGTWRRWDSAPLSGTVSIWDTRTWKEVPRPRLNTTGVLGVAFSPSGSLLAATADHDTVVLDAATRQELWKEPHSCLVTAVAFGKDDALAIADANGAVTIRAGRTRRLLHTLPAHAGRVFGVAFSADGRRLASAGADGAVRVWDTASGQALPSPRGHVGGAYAVAYSADGRRLVSGGNDAIVRVWDSQTGAGLFAHGGHSSTIHAVAFSPDGSWLASAGRDHTVRIWHASPSSESPTDKVAERK